MQLESNANEISNLGNLVEEPITWSIPPTIDQGKEFSHGEHEAEGFLKVLKSDAVNPTKCNHIALLRNKLCVMNYIPSPVPVDEDNYIYGVFLAGHAPEILDDITHNFLRQSEPPLHNDWQYQHKIANFYKFPGTTNDKKAKEALKLQKSIYTQITSKLADLISIEAPIDRNNLDDLSSFFSFGKRGSDKKREIDSDIKDFCLNGRTITFTIKVSNLKVNKTAPWTVEIRSKLNGISGYGENNLLINSVSPKSADVSEHLTISNQKSTWAVKSTPSLGTYELEIAADVPDYFSEDEIPELEPMFNITPA
jgi:hypothetical protein